MDLLDFRWSEGVESGVELISADLSRSPLGFFLAPGLFLGFQETFFPFVVKGSRGVALERVVAALLGEESA